MRRLRRVLLLLFVLVLCILVVRAWLPERGVPESGFLLLSIGGRYTESPPSDRLSRLVRGPQRTVLELLATLRKASKDERVKGVVLRVTALEVGWAKAQDMRDALGEFRASGKRLVAYLEHELTSGNLEYYVASAAERVFLPPDATNPLTGLLSQFYFLGGVWEKLDVEMQVEKIREYKTAGDMLVNRSMSGAHREMANSLLDSIDQQFVRGIADARALQPAVVKAVIDDCPIQPQAFVAAGLSDGVRFLDELREELIGASGKFLDADEYEAPQQSAWLDPQPSIAVVYASGPIQLDEGGGDGSLIRDFVAAKTLVTALEEAADDDDVAAIVLRVDSPGGSALASDLIWRAVRKATAKKPVVVSMSDVAASGGYYIAAAGSRIVAQPGTLTGSIGVVVAKPNVSGLLARLGITTETLTRGKFARLEDPLSTLTDEERARVVSTIEHVYDLFLERVAEGRKLSKAQADEIGRGRVWTGAQAQERGLVDEMGGFMRAVDRAKELAGIAREREARLVFFPKHKGLLQRLAEYAGASASTALPRAWRNAARLLAPLEFADGTVLTLMPEAIEIR
jgi:protease-4